MRFLYPTRRNRRFQAVVERLENRRVLTSIVGIEPTPNSHVGAVDIGISVTYDELVNPATVSEQSFSVNGMRTARRLDSTDNIGVEGSKVSFVPGRWFQPGEFVQVTATTLIEDVNGTTLANPFVWQFRTRAASGTGVFDDSGQNLPDPETFSLALGDLDRDGDLDVFVPSTSSTNNAWLNDGQGFFSENRAMEGTSFSLAVALGDLDGDGDLDAFVGNSDSDKIWLNDGQGQFTDTGQVVGKQAGRIVVALGDVDGDGDLDGVIGRSGSRERGTLVWLNQNRTIAGDFDGNSALDCDDADRLVAAIVAGADDSAFDITNDESVNQDDLARWVDGAFGTLPGDANLDHNVDGVDLSVWSDHKFSNDNGWCGGDFNADGGTDGADFNIWNENRFLTLAAVKTLGVRVPRPPPRAASRVISVMLVVDRSGQVATNNATSELTQTSRLELFPAVTPPLAVVDLPRFAHDRMASAQHSQIKTTTELLGSGENFNHRITGREHDPGVRAFPRTGNVEHTNRFVA